MPRLLALTLPAILLLSGCYSAMRHAVRGRPPADDEVVLVGDVAFDPAVAPSGNPGVIDPWGAFSHYMVAFGDSPNVEVSYDSMSGIDRFAMITPGKPFAIVAPRHPTYVRMLRVNAENERTASYGRETLTMYVIACTGALQVPIEPTDQYVYIGHLICKHGDGKSVLEIDGSEDGMAEVLPKLIGKHRWVRRIPRIATASTRQE